jgi:pimeloyl-ACP methyl ester carboxylesterase
VTVSAPTRSRTRVQFIHGLEGSPQGSKARSLAAHFAARTPAMDTRDFEGCVASQARELAEFQPQILVGSSFGGAIADALLQRGLWRGPTLLLAQAAQRLGLAPELPQGVRVWIVHGLGDTLVPPDDARELAKSGSPGLVELRLLDDDHPLSAFVESGGLVALVREIEASLPR